MPRRLPLPKGNEKIWYDLLPPESSGQHGRHIYMFRNTRTNQILYTLYPKIQQRTLNQLPFIGKHSVPPRIRPDLWTVHCRVGPFPSAKQGHDAFKKLREFRKLHELSWHENNPEWKHNTKKVLTKLIMNQKENATADLAKVFFMQEDLAEEMAQKKVEREKVQDEFLDKRWAKLDALVKSIENGRIKELEQKIYDCKSNIGNNNGNEEEIARQNQRMAELRREIKEHLWAQRIVQRRDEAQQEIDKVLKPRFQAAQARLREQGKHAEADEMQLPITSINKVRASLLPRTLKPYPEPWSLDGIECQWADLYDAEYAEEWPEAILQSPLDYVERKRVAVLTEEEYRERIEEDRKAVEEETAKAFEDLRIEAENKTTEWA